MKKLNIQTPDLTAGNIAKIAELFPSVITEKEGKDGTVEKAVDFDLLRQSLQGELVGGDDERYRLDWPGKRASLLKANTPIQKTLRPDRESSVNFDTTQNLFIEGDNFEVLKILQESYLGKVKMIYIDPPYNTGNDFVYKDNFAENKEEYEEDLGVEDEEGGKLFRNTDANGRFHSDWLSMMYERLMIARDLLRDDGVIFISIDDNEIHNLRKVCDEVFGESNFVTLFSVENNPKGRKNSKFVSVSNEFCLAYSKKIGCASFNNVVPKDASDMSEDENGDYVRNSGKRVLVGENFLNSPISNINSGKHYSVYFNKKTNEIKTVKEVKLDDMDQDLISSGFKRYVTFREGYFVENTYSESKFLELFNEGKLNIKEDKIYEKHFSEMIQIKSMLTNKKYEAIVNNFKVTYVLDLKTTSAKQYLIGLLGKDIFDFPKNTSYIKILSMLNSEKDDITLDFFAGSCTTADAILQLNAEDGGSRKFIMVQIPEETPEDSEARKAGYKTIAEIGKERIRRAGKNILMENKDTLKKRETPLDIGFRAFKVDTTNIKDVYYHPSELKQGLLLGLADNIKSDRTPEDLLAQVILDLGLELSLPIESKKIKGNTVYCVQGNALVACFDDVLDFDIVDEIAKLEPLKVVFKDASFKKEQDRTNLETRFKRLSPDTVITVL